MGCLELSSPLGLVLRKSDARRYLRETRDARRAGRRPLARLTIVPDPRELTDEEREELGLPVRRYRVGPKAMDVLAAARVDPHHMAISAATGIPPRMVLNHIRSLRLAGMWKHGEARPGNRPIGGRR